jgi:hypothetical protein
MCLTTWPHSTENRNLKWKCEEMHFPGLVSRFLLLSRDPEDSQEVPQSPHIGHTPYDYYPSLHSNQSSLPGGGRVCDQPRTKRVLFASDLSTNRDELEKEVEERSEVNLHTASLWSGDKGESITVPLYVEGEGDITCDAHSATRLDENQSALVVSLCNYGVSVVGGCIWKWRECLEACCCDLDMLFMVLNVLM